MLEKRLDVFGPSFMCYNSSRPCGVMEGMKIKRYFQEGIAVCVIQNVLLHKTWRYFHH